MALAKIPKAPRISAQKAMLAAAQRAQKPTGSVSFAPTGAYGGGTNQGSPNTRLKNVAPKAIQKPGATAMKKAVGNTASKTSGSGSGLKGGGSSGGSYSGGGKSSGGGGDGGGGSNGGGGSTGGGGGGTGPTAPGSGTVDPNTGYLPIAGDLFTVAPEGMLADLVQQWYPGEDGNALFQMLRPYADVANIIFLADRGTGATGGTKEEYVLWLKDYFEDMKSTGFSTTPDQLLANIFNASEGSALAAFQGTGNPIEQQQNTQQLAGAVYDTFYHPLMAGAFKRQMDLEGSRFIGRSGREVIEEPFYKYIQGLPSAPMLRPGR